MSLKHKLCIQMIQHFALVLEQVKSLRRNKLTLLNPEHTIARVSIIYSNRQYLKKKKKTYLRSCELYFDHSFGILLLDYAIIFSDSESLV